MKIIDRVLIVVFCVFIFAFGIAFIVMPRESFSVNEKRSLAEMPEFSVDSVFNGNFETGFETYLSDHFPFREKFVAADAYYALYTGRNGSKGIYKGKDGYLFAEPVGHDDTVISENIEALRSFAQNTKIMSTMIIMPTSGYIMSDKLPENHLEYRDGEIIDRIHSDIASDIRWVDISSKFMNARESGQIYYKTDHHYTTYGAYLAYEAFCEEHGLEPFRDYTIESYDGFYGTAYSQSALWNEPGECLEVWRYPSNATVEINGQVYDSLWFDEHLSELDKYPVFLNGNQPFERIINPDVEGGKILILKDSYAHTMVPFLAQHYHQIDMVDLRYYFEPVSTLVNENQYGEIFMIYGLSSLCDDTDISILE